MITQTMTNIEQRIARKSKVYIQWTDPNDGVNEIFEGDIWIKRQTNRTWNEANAAGEKWNQSGVAWKSKYGDLIYSWKNNKWNLVKDTSVDVENEVTLNQTKTSLEIVGHAVDLHNEEYNSRLDVSARAIRSEVSTANSKVYSVIEQTATSIQSRVSNEVAGMQSIIEQTASQIRTEVSNSVSSLRSSISQEADRISLVVEGTGANAHIKPAQIVAAINGAGSTVKISANHIELDGETIANSIYSEGISCSTITSRGQFQSNGDAFFDADVYLEGRIEIPNGKLKVGLNNAEWKSLSFIAVTNVSPSHRFLYAGSSGLTPSNALLSNVVTSYQSKTIYYLGR